MGDYLDALDAFDQALVDIGVRAGVRVNRRQVDLSARSACGIVGQIQKRNMRNPPTSHRHGLPRLGYGLPPPNGRVIH